MKWERGYLNMKVFTLILKIQRLGVNKKIDYLNMDA